MVPDVPQPPGPGNFTTQNPASGTDTSNLPPLGRVVPQKETIIEETITVTSRVYKIKDPVLTTDGTSIPLKSTTHVNTKASSSSTGTNGNIITGAGSNAIVRNAVPNPSVGEGGGFGSLDVTSGGLDLSLMESPLDDDGNALDQLERGGLDTDTTRNKLTQRINLPIRSPDDDDDCFPPTNSFSSKSAGGKKKTSVTPVDDLEDPKTGAAEWMANGNPIPVAQPVY